MSGSLFSDQRGVESIAVIGRHDENLASMKIHGSSPANIALGACTVYLNVVLILMLARGAVSFADAIEGIQKACNAADCIQY